MPHHLRRWAAPLVVLLTALLLAQPGGASADTPGGGHRGKWGQSPILRHSTPIAVAEQATRRVLLLDPTKETWDPVNDPSVVLWSFSPDNDPRYADLDPKASFTYVDEAKVRRRHGRTYLLTNASGGFAGVVGYPGGDRYWAANLGPSVNIHTTELLPNGNVALAASTGGLVRVYAASQGPADTTYAEYRFPGAHGLRWDDREKVLWALGDTALIALRVGGTDAAPTLTLDRSYPLPTPWGHDLTQVGGDRDRMWVTTGSQVYQFSKSRGAFLQDYRGVSVINRVGVKSIGDDPRTGQVISIAPDPSNPCTWCSGTVQVYDPDGNYTLIDGGMYKARWWVPKLGS